MSMMAFIQWGGYTAAKLPFEGRLVNLKPVHYGFNTPLVPSPGRIIRAGGKASDEELTEDDIFDLTLIDKAVERAKLANPKLRPVNVNGEKVYVMYLHTTQVTSLRTNTSDGQWLDITKAAYTGSRKNNPIFDGSLGLYNGVILREAEHVVPGVATNGKMVDTVRRAVLLGAQSAVAAYGMKNNPDKFKRVEELFDYQRQLGVSAQTILGMKKTQFDGEDFGTIVVSTYAKPAE
jgi:N4-gp56 family major capsid protein